MVQLLTVVYRDTSNVQIIDVSRMTSPVMEEITVEMDPMKGTVRKTLL